MVLTCGCGRTMAADGAKPVGHFRCGCGWRVRVSTGPAGRCVAIRSNGHQCGREARIHRPVELCLRHIEKLVETGDHAFSLALRNVATGMDVEQRQERERQDARQRANGERMERQEAARQDAMAAQSVVYYVRIGEYIKIGTTRVMKQRFANLDVDEVLATEPGGRQQESIRHRQFADLKAKRREYFRPDDRLLRHIEWVREKHGEPVVTGYPKVQAQP